MTKLTFLGTGTSQGVPIIGCQCAVCTSSDSKDKRYRASVLVEHEGLTILVDAGPDFRSQMLRAGVRHVDAILLTHNHLDHTGGLDDTRGFNYIDRKVVDIYCEPRVMDSLKQSYSYAFAEEKYPGAPEWHMHLIDDTPFEVKPSHDGNLEWVSGMGYAIKHEDGSITPTHGTLVTDHRNGTEGNIIPIRGFHGQMPVLGFRFGDIAYITDMSKLPESEFDKLKGLKHLTLNTVGYRPHHSHFCLDEAIALARRIDAKHTWLTHLSHTFPVYTEFCKNLPEGIAPSFDGLVID